MKAEIRPEGIQGRRQGPGWEGTGLAGEVRWMAERQGQSLEGWGRAGGVARVWLSEKAWPNVGAWLSVEGVAECGKSGPMGGRGQAQRAWLSSVSVPKRAGHRICFGQPQYGRDNSDPCRLQRGMLSMASTEMDHGEHDIALVVSRADPPLGPT